MFNPLWMYRLRSVSKGVGHEEVEKIAHGGTLEVQTPPRCCSLPLLCTYGSAGTMASSRLES